MTRRALAGCVVALLALSHGAGATEFDSAQSEIGPVGTFTLTERGGAAFRPEDLRGKVWVAHFFYTTCPGPCTKTLPTMKRLQELVRGKPDYALVSITVKSAHDTLDVLREYADQVGADPRQWLFLTGDEADVHRVVRENFKHAVERSPNPKNPAEDVTHSPNLVVVDRDGVMRGYVDGTTPDAADRLFRRMRELAGAKYRLPAINAGLNTACTVLLVLGYVAIRYRRETLHTALMLAALATSATFLACYLYYHFVVLAGQPPRFPGDGWVRGLYLAILLTHTVLAAAVAPLALYVAYQGWVDRRPRHVRVARWTLPLWLYVSVTGVVVYVMLYQLYPPY